MLSSRHNQPNRSRTLWYKLMILCQEVLKRKKSILRRYHKNEWIGFPGSGILHDWYIRAFQRCSHHAQLALVSHRPLRQWVILCVANGAIASVGQHHRTNWMIRNLRQQISKGKLPEFHSFAKRTYGWSIDSSERPKLEGRPTGQVTVIRTKPWLSKHQALSLGKMPWHL